MRLAMAQGSMSRSLSENLEKSVDDMRMAAKSGADMIIFPELQLSPFFPKYHSRKRQCVDLSYLCFSNMFC